MLNSNAHCLPEVARILENHHVKYSGSHYWQAPLCSNLIKTSQIVSPDPLSYLERGHRSQLQVAGKETEGMCKYLWQAKNIIKSWKNIIISHIILRMGFTHLKKDSMGYIHLYSL